MAFVGIDVSQTRINFHPEKSLRQLSSSRLANRRIHAYHSVIAMSLLHPALLMLTFFIVLRIRSKSLRFRFHHKQCYHSYGSKATGGSKGKTTRPPLTIETTVLMCVYAEKGEMYLQVIIHQRLVMSGDVELNPGPLDASDLRNVMNELGSVMVKWFSIGVQLGVSYSKLQEIGTNCQTVDRCCCEVINFWLNGNTTVAVSWKSLAEVLESSMVGEKGLARKLREKRGLVEPMEMSAAAEHGMEKIQTQEIIGGGVGKKRSAEEKLDDNGDENVEFPEGPEPKKAKLKVIPAVPLEPSQTSENEDTSRVGLTSHSSQATGAEETVSPKPQFTFQCLNLQKLSKDERERLHQKLYSESASMMSKYQKLFSATTKSLKDRKVSIPEILCQVAGLGPQGPMFDYSDLPAFGCKLPGLSQAKNTDEVMLCIGNYCSFFYFEMLECIIDNLGTEQDKMNLTKYKEEFQLYAERHVFECPSELCEMSDEGHANMFVTLDDAYKNCNVSNLHLFVSKLQELLNLSSGSGLKLCRIAPGSLKLTFQLPHAVQQAIFPLSRQQEEALARLGVTELSCGDYLFTNKPAEDHEVKDIVEPAADLCVEKPDDTFSIADSALGTSSIITGATMTGVSQFSEDLMLRDLRDEPYLRMEAKLGPPDDSRGLELHQAAYRGELDRVKQLIEEKELNPLQGDKNGNNALHYTAGGGHLPVMKYLIEEQGLNPACQGQQSRTPLHYAAQYKHLELVKFLIGEQRIDPLCQDEYGYTPLHRACIGGDIDVIQYLISEIKKHTSLDSIVYDRTKAGNTAVDIAAYYGHLPVVKLFISELNFDPNTPGQWSRPPLIHAAEGGHLNVVQYFIEELQSDPSYAPSDKATPLHMAAQRGRLDVIRYLTLNRKCSPLIRNSRGSTPLHNAARNGRYGTVKFFISELNCDPNTPGQWGRTPLHDASQEGHLNIVQYLIDIRKCNPASSDNRKTTPLHLASGKGQLHIVKYLIEEKHCNPLCYDKVNGTPLHWAARCGQLEIVKYLVEACKCPVSIRGAYLNMTPLEQARDEGHTNVVQYLSSQV